MQSPELKNEELVLTFLVEGGDAFISGATMSEKLGLSPAELFKLVETLRRLGYGIEALPAKGYRLVEVPDRLTELEVGPLLEQPLNVGGRCTFYESLPSTNARAFELAREGAFHGDVVIAEQRTEGRGRRGRTWISPPGEKPPRLGRVAA